jgi:hypothetical protein
MKTARILFLVGVFGLWANTPCQATPISLVASNAYEFGAGNINVNYNSATGSFQAVGFTDFFGYDSTDVSVYNPNSAFTLTATVSQTGVLEAGTLTITGDLGNGLETLLTGNLVSSPGGIWFGFVDPPITDKGGGNIFDFAFVITGGDPTILGNYYGLQSVGGVDLDANFGSYGDDIPFTGYWTSDFNNNGGTDNGAGLATVFLIPEPSSILLALTGGVLIVAAYRRRWN